MLHQLIILLFDHKFKFIHIINLFFIFLKILLNKYIHRPFFQVINNNIRLIYHILNLINDPLTKINFILSINLILYIINLFIITINFFNQCIYIKFYLYIILLYYFFKIIINIFIIFIHLSTN